jgi:hypothetical protein
MAFRNLVKNIGELQTMEVVDNELRYIQSLMVFNTKNPIEDKYERIENTRFLNEYFKTLLRHKQQLAQLAANVYKAIESKEEEDTRKYVK